MKRTKYRGYRMKPEVIQSMIRLHTRANTKPWSATADFMNEMYDILGAHHPMTVRQLFYRLVSNQTIPNTIEAYSKVSRDLGNARLQDRIPWDWVEDRVRRPTLWPMYDSPEDFLRKVARQYRREIWDNQPCYIEVAIEKDALSGIFANVLYDYRVNLNVVRGFDSLSASKEMADRLLEFEEADVHILYFGDFDPEGLEIQTALEAVLRHHQLDLGVELELHVKRCALTADDVVGLPKNPAKAKSRLTSKFLTAYGHLVHRRVQMIHRAAALGWLKTEERRREVP